MDLANRLSEEYSITILTIYGKGELRSQLNKKVKVIAYMIWLLKTTIN